LFYKTICQARSHFDVYLKDSWFEYRPRQGLSWCLSCFSPLLRGSFQISRPER